MIYTVIYAASVEAESTAGEMFKYSSPFEIAAPTVVPKLVAKTSAKEIPPNTAYVPKQAKVFLINAESFLVGNAKTEGMSVKVSLTDSAKSGDKIGKNMIAEYKADTPADRARRRTEMLLPSKSDVLYIMIESMRKFIKNSISIYTVGFMANQAPLSGLLSLYRSDGKIFVKKR